MLWQGIGGRSSVGRALACGASCRGFDPRRSPHFYHAVFFCYNRFVNQSEQEVVTPPHANVLPRVLVAITIIAVSFGSIASFISFEAFRRIELLESQIANQSKPSPETAPAQNARISPMQRDQLSEFSDPNIEGMRFTYDPEWWDPIMMNDRHKDVYMRGIGIYLREKGGDGFMTFSYTLIVGMGGGYALFGESDIAQVTDTIVRKKTENRYEYGLKEHLVSFRTSATEKQKMIETCDEMSKPNYEGFTGFDPELCSGIYSGSIVGYVPQPTFSWSLPLNIATSLFEIDPALTKPPYVQSEHLENGKIIVVTTYVGENPEYADEIVKQISF